MALNTTDSSNVLQDVFLNKTYLEALNANTIVLRAATRENAPMHSGKQIRWLYTSPAAAASTPLAEGGDPPSPNTLTFNAVTATLAEYGDYFEPTRLMISTGHSGTMQEIVKQAGEQGALTYDTLAFTQALYDTTSTLGSGAGNALVANDILIAGYTLTNNNAKPNPGTRGGKYFFGIFSAEGGWDVMGEGRDFSTSSNPTWETVHGTDSGIRGASDVPFSPGSDVIYGTQMHISTNVPSESADQHNNYVLGKEAFGALSLESDIMNPGVRTQSPTQRTDKAMPNAWRVSWWGQFVSELLQSNATIELLSDIT